MTILDKKNFFENFGQKISSKILAKNFGNNSHFHDMLAQKGAKVLYTVATPKLLGH